MPTYDEAIRKVGDFGLYQKKNLFGLYCSTLVNGSCIMVISVFVLYSPPHRCYLEELDSDNCTFQYQELPLLPNKNNREELSEAVVHLSRYIPIEEEIDGSLKWSRCSRYIEVLPHGNMSQANGTVISCDRGWKYFTTPLETISAVNEFNLVCDEAWFAPLGPSIMMFGVMAGSIIGGYVSDRWGRRFALLLSWIGAFLSTLFIAVLPIWKISYLFIFVLGACALTRNICSFTLLNEVIPLRHRNIYAYVNLIIWAGSSMMVPLFAYFLTNWRILMGFYAASYLVAFIPLYCWTKESIKWLLRSRRYKDVQSLLREVASVNRRNVHESELLLNEDSQENTCDCEEQPRKDVPKLTYFHLLKVNFLRKRLCIFGIAWFSSTMSYYGLSINTNNLRVDRLLAFFIAAASELPGDLIYFLLNRKFGGRVTFITMTGITGIFLLIPAFLQYVGSWSLVLCSMIGKTFASGSFSTLLVFTGDLFPTLLRSQSCGASSFIGRFAGITVPFILYLGEIYEAIPYLVMGSIAIIGAIAMSFLPETRHSGLPNTMQEAKEQDKNKRTIFCFTPQIKKKSEGRQIEIS